MVSKRQREARKRFKAAHPELFPKPEPTPPKDPNKKITKSKFKPKKKKVDPKSPGDGTRIKKSLRKHPLRVPGMKPGVAVSSAKRRTILPNFALKRLSGKRIRYVCYAEAVGIASRIVPTRTIRLWIRSCVIIAEKVGTPLISVPNLFKKESGHLSKNCPQNTHGIYPKGGGCKICGGVTHLAKDCTNKGNKHSAAANKATRAFSITDERPRGQVTKFVSGDDLEDDFMADDRYSGKKDKSTEPKGGSTSTSQESNLKLKKKQGPKLVNFVG